MQPNATERPAAFDLAVMDYIPALKRLSCKLCNDTDDREELLQDTLAFAFDKWRNFRGDLVAPKSGLYGWLTINMRSIAQARRRRIVPKIVEFDSRVMVARLTEAARQESTIDAAMLMSRLSRTREGRMLARYVKGETMAEIAGRRGVSANRVQQLIEKARDKLRKRLGMARVA